MTPTPALAVSPSPAEPSGSPQGISSGWHPTGCHPHRPARAAPHVGPASAGLTNLRGPVIKVDNQCVFVFVSAGYRDHRRLWVPLGVDAPRKETQSAKVFRRGDESSRRTVEHRKHSCLTCTRNTCPFGQTVGNINEWTQKQKHWLASLSI